MRIFLLSILAVIGMQLSAQTNLQYQAHVTSTGGNVSFSAYIATSQFNENSHLNTTAMWFIEDQLTDVANGMINVTLTNIPDTIFQTSRNDIFVYAYVNGQSIGKLPFNAVPYSVYSKVAENADFASHAITSNSALMADTAIVAKNAIKSAYSTESGNSNTANYANSTALAALATNATTAIIANSVSPNGVTLSAIDGATDAPVGAILTRGVNKLTWVANTRNFIPESDIVVYTVAPTSIPNTVRYVVSKVPADYEIAVVANPFKGQVITIFNGSMTYNKMSLALWGYPGTMTAGLQRTLWYDGTSWVIIGI